MGLQHFPTSQGHKTVSEVIQVSNLTSLKLLFKLTFGSTVNKLLFMIHNVLKNLHLMGNHQLNKYAWLTEVGFEDQSTKKKKQLSDFFFFKHSVKVEILKKSSTFWGKWLFAFIAKSWVRRLITLCSKYEAGAKRLLA